MKLGQLAEIANIVGWAAILTYCRIQAFLLIVPGIGERILPARVRVALAMALTPLLAEIVPATVVPDTQLGMLAQVTQEMLLGIFMGALLRLLALAIDIATSTIAAAASLSQIVGGANEASPHPIGNLLHLGGLAILFAFGLPLLLVDLLVHSFSLWPAGAMPNSEDLVSNAVQLLARSFSLALLLASPFVLGGLLFQALSGVVSKVMPALPVVFIGAPGQIFLALLALAVLSPTLIGIWVDAMLSFTLPVTR